MRSFLPYHRSGLARLLTRWPGALGSRLAATVSTGAARRWSWGGLALLLLVLPGCRSDHSSHSALFGSSLATTNSPKVTLAVMQASVMRFADSYVAETSQAADDFSARMGTPKARLKALRWKLGQATAAYTDATGPNPIVNALDMLVLVTMSRMVLEDYGMETFGQDIVPLVEKQRQLETNAWTLASNVLKPAQQVELRALIQEWRQEHPHLRYVGAIRLREFLAALNQPSAPSKTGANSIFSLLYINPLAGLDPATAAIEETRQMGERAIYYTQRMPQLLSWQTELLVLQLADQPESKQLLADADRLAATAEVFAQTAQQLPQLINDQRQAAIQQVLEGLTAEGDKSRALLPETRTTLDAANAAAASINTAVQSLTEFVRYVTPTNAAPKAPANTNSKPFNVLDYGTAAAQIGVAATNLQTLLAAVQQTTPQLVQLGQQATADANEVVDRAFRRGLLLIAFLLIGSVVAALSYRILANKLLAGRTKTTPPKKALGS